MAISGVWLASASSRRETLIRQCLAGCEIWFAAAPLLTEEKALGSGLEVREKVALIADEKAVAARIELNLGRHLKLDWQWLGDEKPAFGKPTVVESIIAIVADTLVVDPDDPFIALGQPEDELSAASILLRLSGRRHAVWSATVLVGFSDSSGDSLVGQSKGYSRAKYCAGALVEFDELGEAMLAELLSSGKWRGKAGAYDLAGAAGKHARLVEGDELSVLGLAPEALAELSQRINARS
ncbi:MAG TPA: hypothetical protein EYN46_00615 [Candidatus Poseidoniales archaeon]|nr:MAG: hypothetical protein CXX80_05215 [Euryarchaeota archaeon]HIA90411.1 hypothetical protein [Candidatus Poseidoniales archaeon]HIB58935.1 hypothetical protein [Candidatus Poseidoniales archaeon]HIO93855.1 hypothetical protein [Candidatus Poseidoniales archaeon]